MTFAPVLHLAMGLLISNEMIAPLKPMTLDITSKALRFKPPGPAIWPIPSKLSTIEMTRVTARLVAINRKMRFIGRSLIKVGREILEHERLRRRAYMGRRRKFKLNLRLGLTLGRK